MSKKNNERSHKDSTRKSIRRATPSSQVPGSNPTQNTPPSSVRYAVNWSIQAQPLRDTSSPDLPEGAPGLAVPVAPGLFAGETGEDPFRELAERLRSARADNNFTQQQLGAAIGVHTTFITHIETLKKEKSGGALPSYTNTAALERVLNLPAGELWDLVEKARAFMRVERSRKMQEVNWLALQSQLNAVGTSATKDLKLDVPLFKDELDDEEFQGFSEMINDIATIVSDRETWLWARPVLRAIAAQVEEKRRQTN